MWLLKAMKKNGGKKKKRKKKQEMPIAHTQLNCLSIMQ